MEGQPIQNGELITWKIIYNEITCLLKRSEEKNVNVKKKSLCLMGGTLGFS